MSYNLVVKNGTNVVQWNTLQPYLHRTFQVPVSLMGERFPYYNIWVKRFKYHIKDLYTIDNRVYPALYRRTKM
jgi:hypothetical protein